MDDSLLLGLWRTILPVPPKIWRTMMHRETQGGNRLEFMTADHHRVRDFVVVELPRAGKALSPKTIAGRLDLPLAKVVAILDELERHLTFLYRNAEGAVTWAYPVTVDATPHRVTFGSGERVHAA